MTTLRTGPEPGVAKHRRASAVSGVTDPAPAFRVLFVCAANICRSPLAQFLLVDARRHASLGGSTPWLVSSAGTTGFEREPLHPLAAAVLAERGISPTPFESRRISEPLLRDTDLILAASRRHRSKVVALLPAAVRRTFTLRQLARLVAAGRAVEGDPSTADGFDLLDYAVAGRRQPPDRTLTRDDDDIVDPMGGTMDDFRACADTITAALSAFILNE